MAKETITHSVVLEIALSRRMVRMCKAQRRSRSSFIAQAIKENLDQNEAFIKAMDNPLLRESLAKAFSNPEVIKQFAQAMTGDELTDEKLELFGNVMQGLASAAPKSGGGHV